MLEKPELLSPAGDMEALRYAVVYGADAVYLGAKAFGMRGGAKNFDEQQLQQAAAFAHGFGRRIYLTLNTVPTNEEMDALPALVRSAAAAGVDAFIVADLGVLRTVQAVAPGVTVHFSTQAGIVNYAAATAAYELGASRVVLAREMTLEDIAALRAKTPPELELEAFVHGAMCVSFSGRCLLSHYLSGRDSNRGQCAQPCRWQWDIRPTGTQNAPYTLCEGADGGGEPLSAEWEDSAYILSADDLCMAPFLDAVLAAGVDSLKIEGRAKSFYYTASVTAAYRRALDAWLAAPDAFLCPEQTLTELTRTSHRRYGTGFYFGRDAAAENRRAASYLREWDVMGTVDAWDEGMAVCTQRGKIFVGDELELLTPGGEVLPLSVPFLLDENGEPIDATPRSLMTFSLPVPQEVPPMSILRRRTEGGTPASRPPRNANETERKGESK